MTFNEGRLRFVLSSPAGPVGRHLARTGARIESVAKALATSEKLVRTGRYRASISWRLSAGLGLLLEVGSAVPYARIIERGSDPHTIPVGATGTLWWTHGADRGWVVPTPNTGPILSVNHPGTRAYGIIGRATRQVLGRGLILP